MGFIGVKTGGRFPPAKTLADPGVGTSIEYNGTGPPSGNRPRETSLVWAPNVISSTNTPRGSNNPTCSPSRDSEKLT